MRTAVVAFLLGAAIPAQAITWCFTDEPIPTCPSAFGQPCIEDPGGVSLNPQHSVNGSITITWWQFDANAPVMLWLSTDQSRSFFPPCVLVPPDVMMTGVTNALGEARFTWPVPVTAPLSVVPLGINTMGALQAIEIATVPPTITSYAVNIVSMR